MTDPRLAADVDACCRLTGEFTLRSGQVASEYFDKYLFESDPQLLARVVAQMSDLLPEGTELLGGLELGGVPIVTVLSARVGLPALFVRKKAKEYGTCKLAEGPAVDGRRVTLVEDVITTGGAVREALEVPGIAGARTSASESFPYSASRSMRPPGVPGVTAASGPYSGG